MKKTSMIGSILMLLLMGVGAVVPAQALSEKSLAPKLEAALYRSGPDELIRAVYVGDARKIMHLIKRKKVDVNAPNSWGWTPLGLAVHRGYKEIAYYLIRAHANLDAKDKNGKTPLQYAAQWGATHKDIEIFEMLIDAGAKPIVYDKCVDAMLYWLKWKDAADFMEMFNQRNLPGLAHPIV